MIIKIFNFGSTIYCEPASTKELNINGASSPRMVSLLYYYIIIIIYERIIYHLTVVFRALRSIDFCYRDATRLQSRCRDARSKNTSQKVARSYVPRDVKKERLVKSAYHGRDCFGLKSTAFFVVFFSPSPLLLFSIYPSTQGLRAYIRDTYVEDSLSSLDAQKGCNASTL